jgi:hypothetical protein
MHVGLDNEYNSIHPHARCTLDNTIEIEYGLVTGYTGSNIAPMLRIKKDNFFIAPAYEVEGNIGIVVGFEFKLK